MQKGQFSSSYSSRHFDPFPTTTHIRVCTHMERTHTTDLLAEGAALKLVQLQGLAGAREGANLWDGWLAGWLDGWCLVQKGKA